MSDMSQVPSFISQDECQEMSKAMNTKYRLALKDRQFHIEASHQGRGVYITVLLKNEDESFYYPVEARVIHEAQEMTARNAALFLIDYIDMYFEEFLLEEDESLYVPIDWADHQYDAVDFQVRGQILNRKLENLADQILNGRHVES